MGAAIVPLQSLWVLNLRSGRDLKEGYIVFLYSLLENGERGNTWALHSSTLKKINTYAGCVSFLKAKMALKYENNSKSRKTAVLD